MTDYDLIAWANKLSNTKGWTSTCIILADYVRAVIADEAAKQKRDEENPAKGDVPKWFMSVWNTPGMSHIDAWLKIESEIARRVEAAVQTDCVAFRNLDLKLAAAQAEVERLSRPVENETVIHHLPESRRYVPIANFVAERNAREAAEARERKLREFVRHRYIYWFDKVTTGKYSKPITEAELDRLLAAFDADGKVQA